MTGVRQEISVHCPMDVLFGVITDYDRYPEFLPDMEEVRIIGEQDGAKEVEFRLNLIKRFRYVLRLRDEPPTQVSWELVEGLFERNQGRWELSEVGPEETHAVYHLDVAVGLFVPGAVSKRLVRKTLPKTLDAFKSRAEAVFKEKSA